jgi:hypothetical protein
MYRVSNALAGKRTTFTSVTKLTGLTPPFSAARTMYAKMRHNMT